MRLKLNMGSAKAAFIAGAMVYAWNAAAADARPVMEALQAQCIQEAMLRGAVGERLKGYVDSCVKAKARTPLQDLQPFSTDTPAC